MKARCNTTAWLTRVQTLQCDWCDGGNGNSDADAGDVLVVTASHQINFSFTWVEEEGEEDMAGVVYWYTNEDENKQKKKIVKNSA